MWVFPFLLCALRDSVAIPLSSFPLHHAAHHRNLSAMPDRVLHNSIQHVFIRVSPPRRLLPQISFREIPHPRFQQVAAPVPLFQQFFPRNRRLRPLFLRFPLRHRTTLRSFPDPLIPKQQMLQQLRNRVSRASRLRHGHLRRNFRQHLPNRRPVPRAFHCHRPVRRSNLFALVHVSFSLARLHSRPLHFTTGSTTCDAIFGVQ